jgi:hypothetical protein
MIEAWSILIENLNDYMGGSVYGLFYLIAAVYILLADKDKRKTIMFPAILLMIFIINPISYKYIWEKTMSNGTVQWRAYWMIPIVLMIAYAVVRAIFCVENILIKIILLLLMVVCIISGGNNVYMHEYNFETSENYYKIPQEAIEVSDILLADNEEPRVVMETGLYCYIRQYSTKIKMMYGRNSDGYMSGGYGIMPQQIFSVRWCYDFSELNVKWIHSVSKEGAYKYIVVSNTRIVNDSDLDECGYYLIGETEHYKIYRTDNI